MYGKCVLTVLMCAGSLQATLQQNPSAQELIDKCAATQDKLWASFIIRMENSGVWEAQAKERPQLKAGERRRRDCIREYRCDGERNYSEWTITWEGLLSGANELKNPVHSYEFWDGKVLYSYSYAIGTKESAMQGKEGTITGLSYARPAHRDSWRATDTRALMGYYPGVNDDERIDGELRQATTLSVEPRTDLVNGSACYVIAAKGGGCEYHVWIDPKHGYNIAKASVRRNWISWGRPEGYSKRPQDGYQTMQLTATGFKEVDGVWVYQGADWKYETRAADGDYNKEEHRIKITQYLRNPDHEALGSFKRTFIREGAKVFINPSLSYIWHDDKVVDSSGKLVDLQELSTAKNASLLKAPLPPLTTLSKDLSQAQTSGQPLVVCLCDIEQRPSRQCLADLAQKAAALSGKGVTLVVIQTAKLDLKQYESWMKTARINLPIHVVEGDFDTQKAAWAAKSLPWLILTDKSHVVRAEGFAVSELDKTLQDMK